jgi:vacuolar protein sorting-associated protein VTA1
MNSLDDLEKEKSALLLQNEDIMTNDLVGFAHVSNFAYKVFSLADNEDRSGASSKYFF